MTTDSFKQNPRKGIVDALKNHELGFLLREAGKLHGHFCPGLAMGVMAASYAMQRINELSDGMEDLLAITETNSCFADGVQYVTGCTFGNNALVYNDWGKTAFTLAQRSGKGIRVRAKNDSREKMQKLGAGFFTQFQKVIIEKNHEPKEKEKLRDEGSKISFAMLEMPFDNIFECTNVQVEIPAYAPIHESFICDTCGEATMGTRKVEKDGETLCLSCANQGYMHLNGYGIFNK